MFQVEVTEVRRSRRGSCRGSEEELEEGPGAGGGSAGEVAGDEVVGGAGVTGCPSGVIRSVVLILNELGGYRRVLIRGMARAELF